MSETLHSRAAVKGSERSPLRGRYLVKNRPFNALLYVSDAMLAIGTRSRKPAETGQPRRLLVAVGGHLGDAVIATSAIGVIRDAWPNVQIGIITGSWNAAVFAAHPDIRWLHFADHWKLNRSGRPWFSRALRTLRSERVAIDEIRDTGYDAAIDLYPYYPNTSRLLKRTAIPVRVGYVSGGGGPRYTHALPWSPGTHVSYDHRRLLAVLGINAGGEPSYRLAPITADAASNAQRKLREAAIFDGYIALHMGAGTARKSWPLEKWTEVANELRGDGIGIVLTGGGARDSRRTRELASTVRNTANLCDALTWAEFRHVLAGARATISVDTVAAHLSAAAGTPTIVIMTGMDDPERWRPLGDNVTVLTERVQCFPCYRSNGCAAMSCIADVTARSVLTAIEPYLDASTTAPFSSP
jgi:ADP-heptose:LPS heptosyltransferase